MKNIFAILIIGAFIFLSYTVYVTSKHFDHMNAVLDSIPAKIQPEIDSMHSDILAQTQKFNEMAKDK